MMMILRITKRENYNILLIQKEYILKEINEKERITIHKNEEEEGETQYHKLDDSCHLLACKL